MKSTNKEPVTFSTGCAIEKDYIYIAAKPDKLDDEDEFTRLFFFDAQNTARPWVHHDLNGWDVVSVCVAVVDGGKSREYCALSKQGDIEFMWVSGKRIERIEGAGLRRDVSPTGFTSVSACSEVLIFSSLGILNNRVFLASNKGLFSLDDDGIIRRVRTSLTPEVKDTNIIDVKDGILWSFGYKDIVYYDGSRWNRLMHPDNI